MKISPAWRYYVQLFRGSYRIMVFNLLIAAGQSAFLLPIMLLVRYIFDTVLPSENVGLLIRVGASIFLLYVVNAIIDLHTRYVTLRLTKSNTWRLRNELLQRFYVFSRTFYSRADLSKIHTNVVQDTERLDVMSNQLFGKLIPSVAIALLFGVMLAILNPLLFLVILALKPILYFINKWLGRRIRREVRIYRETFETFSKGVLFILQMMDLTRAQAAEQVEIARQSAHHEELHNRSSSLSWMQSAYTTLQSVLFTFWGILILIIGGMGVAAGSMSIGDLITFYVAFGLLSGHLRNISDSIPVLITGNESLNALYDLIQTDDRLPYEGVKPIDFQGEIALEGVRFHYDRDVVLHNVSLSIRSGESIAIIGASGVGKSTIINLILGFYRPDAGQLYADGHPYDDIDLVELRRQMGVVMQDPILFPGTIAENIAYGYPDTTPQQISRAAELAVADDFISQLPNGYQTNVGENGVLISGGQRQRLAIARALLHEPRLLILDEPTNHLDANSMSQLIHNLKTLDNAPAIVVISHNMELVREMQQVYMLHDGQLTVEPQSTTVSSNGGAHKSDNGVTQAVTAEYK